MARLVPGLVKVLDLFPVHPGYKAAIRALVPQVVFLVLFPMQAFPAELTTDSSSEASAGSYVFFMVFQFSTAINYFNILLK
jgi:hypothetical protein